MESSRPMELDKLALGLAGGILWGAAILLVTFVVMARQGGVHLVLLNKVYFGYSVTVPGAFVGLVWGFVDGFIGGWLLAWLYNLLVRRKAAV